MIMAELSGSTRVSLRERYIVGALLILMIVIPVVLKVSIPGTISPETRGAYDFLHNLEPGSTVLVCLGTFAPHLWAEVGPGGIASMNDIFNLPVRIIIVPFDPEGAATMKMTLDRFIDEREKVYGVDWVFLQFIPGGEAGIAAFRDDFHMVSTDFFGDPISEMPLMQESLNTDDVDALWFLDGGNMCPQFVRQLVLGGNTPGAYGAMDAEGYVITLPYFTAGQLQGLISAGKGAYEYELLTGIPGMGTLIMNGLTLAHFYLVALIIFCNIKLWWPKITGRGEK
jgi:hypothetical protein